MAFLIGIDEAGYGPNLGPLVIAATLWQVPDGADNLYELLGDLVCRPGESPEVQDGACCPLVIGDSKQVYKSGAGLAPLELPVGAMLHGLGNWRNSAASLFECLTGIEPDQLSREPGYDWDAARLPVAIPFEEIDGAAAQVRRRCDAAGVWCKAMGATTVFPADWNQGLRKFGNKATVLSVMSCRLVRRMLDVIADLPDAASHRVGILCDRHGGRSRYAALIQEEITAEFVRVRSETRDRSHYEWREACGRPVQISFLTRGEGELPIALSSMLAKYLRELSMVAWNRFWQTRLEDLRPTAGYPGDSRRFRKEIAHVQKSLQIRTRAIWRSR